MCLLFLLESIYFLSLFIRVYRSCLERDVVFICVFLFFSLSLSPDVFLGPVCEYVISPVGRYAGVWNIPLITAAAQADGFTNKQPNFLLLTRMMGSYR